MVFEIAAGLGSGDLRWSVGYADGIDVLSELTYSGITIVTGAASLIYTLHSADRHQWLLGLDGSIGNVVGGTARDSDYAAPGRDQEYSRTYAEITGDGFRSESAAIGWRTGLPGRIITDVTVWLGYRRERQTLRKQNGEQAIPESSGAIEGLDSRYEVHWTAPLLAVEPTFGSGRSRIDGRLAVHIPAHYFGEGEWNLRDEFAQPRSFVHIADGAGLEISIRATYAAGSDSHLFVGAEYIRRSISEGVDMIFLRSGDLGGASLREATWQSLGVEIGAALQL